MNHYYLEVQYQVTPIDAVDEHTEAMSDALSVEPNLIDPDVGADLRLDLDAIGIHTWIPQPVAGEWAEHLAKQWTTARNAIKTPADHLRRAGLLPLLRLEPGYDDRARSSRPSSTGWTGFRTSRSSR